MKGKKQVDTVPYRQTGCEEVSEGENEAPASDTVSPNSSIFSEPVVFSRSVGVSANAMASREMNLKIAEKKSGQQNLVKLLESGTRQCILDPFKHTIFWGGLVMIISIPSTQ